MVDVFVLTQEEEPATLPEYASTGASGADVKAHLKAPLTIKPGKSALVPTGLFFEIPEGYEIQVRPRSGLALNKQITVINTPGTIDADYRGEVKIILINHGQEDFIVEPGMRIAQLVLAEVTKARFIKVKALQETRRGEGGFGHSGIK